MSILNQLFNRSLLGPKCKTCLNLAISRIKLLQNKREMQLKLMRKEIGQFLQAGQEPIARIRVEHVIREENIWNAYEILEMFCEFVLARVPILESQRECPIELREAVASIIFAAPRCSDLPDLLQIKNLFAAKYGKEFIAAASELRPDTSVNRTIIEKLAASAPSADVRLKVLKDIAREHKVEWDSSKTEEEFKKRPEDLLNGPRQVFSDTSFSHLTSPQGTLEQPPLIVPAEKKQAPAMQPPPSPAKTVSFSSKSEISTLSTSNYVTRDIDMTRETRPQSSDALERARAAIAVADRATAAARAAALLVNVKLGSHTIETQSS